MASGDAFIEWNEFLESHPPESTPRTVLGSLEFSAGTAPPVGSGSARPYTFRPWTPNLTLPCESTACQGKRIFEYKRYYDLPGLLAGFHGYSLLYRCRNCDATEKLFAVMVEPRPPDNIARAFKLGEWPPFGEEIPNSAMKLIEPDRLLFLQGRKSENRGLGIGALTYYRRVLDNQKGRIIDEILKAARVLTVSAQVIKDLEWARDAWRFEKAVDRIKDAIPDSLRIDGQNPLLLLHRALSEGIHGLSDTECLQRAQAVRIVLTELARRIETVLQDRSEVHEAVKELMKLEEKRGSKEDPNIVHKGEAQTISPKPT